MLVHSPRCGNAKTLQRVTHEHKHTHTTKQQQEKQDNKQNTHTHVRTTHNTQTQHIHTTHRQHATSANAQMRKHTHAQKHEVYHHVDCSLGRVGVRVPNGLVPSVELPLHCTATQSVAPLGETLDEITAAQVRI
jgi:hypothetical protein